MPLMHHNISAWITSENVNLQEHCVTVDYEKNVVSCFIPGVVGQKFTVWWTNLDASATICTFITLDGCRVPGKIGYGPGTACRSGGRVSGNTQRPFVFKDVTDGGSSNADMSMDVGTITLKVKRVRLEAPEPVKAIRPLPSDALLGKRKAAGDGDFRVGFGEEEPTEPQLPLTWKLSNADFGRPPGSLPKTFVTFIFRYRSQEFLNSRQMIIGQNTHFLPYLPISSQPSQTPVAQSTEEGEDVLDSPARKKQKLRHSSTAPESSPHTSTDQTYDADISLTSSPSVIATPHFPEPYPTRGLTPLMTSHPPVVPTSQQQPGVSTLSASAATTSSVPIGSNKDIPTPLDLTEVAHRACQETLSNQPSDYRENPLDVRFVEFYHASTESSSSHIQVSTSRNRSKTTARKASKSRAVSATNPPMAATDSPPQSTESKRASSWTGQIMFDLHPRDDSNTPPSA